MKLLKRFARELANYQYDHGLETPPEVHYDYVKPGISREDFCREREVCSYVSTNPIRCPEIVDYVGFLKPDLYDILKSEEVIPEYELTFFNWITSSPSRILGLEDFKYQSYTQGSQETFTHYIVKHRDKRFRLFYKEYFYHFNVLDYLGTEWCYMHEDDLKEGDVVIISYPFAGNGMQAEGFDEVLDTCDALGIPVLLDLIHFPNSSDCFEFQCNRDCVEVITFSLSKTFPIQPGKCGIRFLKENPKDIIELSRSEGVNNKLGAWLGTQVMDYFPADYVQNRYRDEQKFWCRALGLEPSPIVHLAWFDAQEEWRPTTFSPYNYQKGRVNLKVLYENPNISREILQKIENGH